MSRSHLLPVVLILGACKAPESTVETTAEETLATLTLDGPEAFSGPGTQRAWGNALGFVEVEIDGDEADLDDTHDYEGEVTLSRGLTVIEAFATEPDGDTDFARRGVLAGDFGSPDAMIAKAAVVRVNEGGLDLVSELVEEQLESGLVEDALAGANPIYEDTYGVFGWDAVEIRADVTDFSFHGSTISLDPSQDGLLVGGEIQDLHLTVIASGDIVGAAFQSTVEVDAAAVDIKGTLRLHARDGKLEAEMLFPEVELLGFDVDLSLIPGDIDGGLLIDAIEGFLTSKIEAILTDTVPVLLADKLSALSSLEVDLMGQAFVVTPAFSDASTDDGGLELAVDLGVASSAEDHGGGVLLAAHHDPNLDATSDVSMGIYDDLINTALYQAWRMGLLSMTLSTEDGSLDGAMLQPLGAEEGSITVHADLPPVLVEKEDGTTELQLGEFMVELDTPGGKLGDSLTVAISAAIPVDLEVRDGAIEIGIGAIVPILDVRSTSTKARDVTVTRLLEEELPLGTLLSALQDLSFALPEMAGVSIFHGEIARDSGGSYTNVALYLEH